MADGLLVETWSDAPDVSRNDPSTQIASARFDGEAYVVVCTEDDRLRAYDHLGVERWLSDPMIACDAPTVGDLDGTASVVTEGGIVSLATGQVSVPFAVALSGPPLIADVFGPTLGNEIVTPNEVLQGDGTPIANTSRPGSFVVVADLDGDAAPEMITVESGSGQHELVIWQLDPAGSPVIVRADVDTHASMVDICLPADPGADRSGGPPAIADLTGDGTMDLAVAGARGVVVFDGAALMNTALPDDQTVLMEIPLIDCDGGRRGLSAFDFDHDGINELVARDALNVHILSTLSASVTWSACNPTEAGFGITPIADVDRDGSADLLGFASARTGANCSGATHSGVTVFSHDAGKWAGAPRVWRQHIDLTPDLRADGTITALVSPWTEFIPPGVHAAPATNEAANLRVTVLSQCSLVMQVEVENLGITPVPANAAFVRLYGTVGPMSSDIARIPIPVSVEAGSALLLEHQIDVTTWSDLSAYVEYESGRAVHECDVNDNHSSVDCKN
jgi:hypothetical protein